MNRFKAAALALLGKSSRLHPLATDNPAGWGGGDLVVPSGESVTARSALGLSAVWACVNLLAGTVASLPLMVYRTGADGSRTVARDVPLYRILHDSPNGLQTALDFWEFICASIELWGNGYARKVKASDGRPVSLVPIMPGLPQVTPTTGGRLRYLWSEDGVSYDLTSDDVFHVRGFGGNPLGGMSTLSFGARAFGLAMAVDRAAGSTFANGLRPSGVLSFKDFLTDDQRAVIDRKLVEKFQGAMNAGRPLILEGGSSWSQLGVNPEDAQMLQSRGFSVEEVCRFFGIPPFMIGHNEKSSGYPTSLEQQVLTFQKFSLRRRLKRIEQAAEKQLLTPADRAEGITIEFNLEGLLRGDSAGRAGFYARMTQIGAMTINEVRALENLPPVAGGDVPRMQSQNVPITAAPEPPSAQ